LFVAILLKEIKKINDYSLIMLGKTICSKITLIKRLKREKLTKEFSEDIFFRFFNSLFIIICCFSSK